MGEKRTTSAECQTIRIAESSDMDVWEAVLRPMCKSLIIKNESDVICYHYTKGSVWKSYLLTKKGFFNTFTVGKIPTVKFYIERE